ncbi:TniQ family protein [Pseudomonas veronii]|uniref:TniQ family protein n=1 Tax=Pseudomonas veronii TaxID=76761 RepID=UPI00398800C9
MGTFNTYRWRSRADPVNALWPLVPALLDDEVISSWLVRCALAQGCEPTTLAADVWPDLRLWSLDPDREFSERQLTALSERSGISVDALRASTLMPWQHKMTGSACFPKGVAAWFLCLGTRNRRRCGGLQYCPQCFAQETPHYLLQNRFAWHTACPIHHVGLLDHCEQCHAPLCPHLNGPPTLDLGRCHRCGYELGMATPELVLEGALRFQVATDDLFNGASHRYGLCRLALVEWLTLAKWMLSVLRAGGRTHGTCTDDFFSELGVSPDGLSRPITGLAFEYLSPEERGRLLSDVWSMIGVGPERLIAAAKRDHVRPSLLIPRKNPLPDSLADLSSVLQECRHKQVSQNHVDKPRSPDSVLMRWNRLLRKFER